MSILIQGMEMPQDCVACDFFIPFMSRGLFNPLGHCKRSREEVNTRARRLESCPLIELPPHGRLIDGDELAKGCDDPYWCRWLSEIEDAPTIIPAESSN